MDELPVNVPITRDMKVENKWRINKIPEGYIVDKVDGSASLPGYYTSLLQAERALIKHITIARNACIGRPMRKERD